MTHNGLLLTKLYNFWDLMTYFCLKVKMYELCAMTMKNDAKIEEELTCQLKNWHEECDEFWHEHSKISKICSLVGFFWTKYIMFELKKHKRVLLDSTEDWCNIWRKTDLCFQKWHKQFSKFSPEHVRKSKNWDWWDCFIQSRNFMSLKFTGEFWAMSMKNDIEAHGVEWGAEFLRQRNLQSNKILRDIDLSVENQLVESDKFWSEHLKIPKICTLIGRFWPKYIMLELKTV